MFELPEGFENMTSSEYTRSTGHQLFHDDRQSQQNNVKESQNPMINWSRGAI